MRSFSHIPLFLLLAGFASAQSDCQLLTQQSVNKNGQILFQLTNSYNSEGKLIEEHKAVSQHLQGTYTERKVYEYNAKGYLSKISSFHNEAFKSAKFRSYNNLGELIAETETTDLSETKTNNVLTTSNLNSEKLYFAEDNSISAREVTKKNENGQILTYEIKSGAGVVNHSKEFRYSSSGKETYERRDDLIGNMSEEILTSYMSNGNIEKDSTYLNGKLIGKTLFTYQNGHVTEKAVYGRNNDLDYQILYVNDGSGNPTKETFVYQGRLMNSVEKSYDSAGNLILEKSFDSNNILQKTITLEYNCP